MVFLLEKLQNRTMNKSDHYTTAKMMQKRTIIVFLLAGFFVGPAFCQKLSRTSSQSGGGGILAQSFLREPFDQIAAVGEHVTLPCRVINKRGVLQWTRDDFGLGSERQLIGFDRYQMTGSDEEGDWTLDINPVTLEDDARFQCQIGAAEPSIAPIRSRYATLSVLVPPNPPKMLGGSGQMADGQTIHKTVEGRQVELRCESRGGKPAAEITWFTDDNVVIDEGVRTRTEVMKDGKRHVTISTLKFAAMTEHHNKNFTCQAQNSAIRQPQSVSTRLHVHYPPHVELIADHGNDGYVEEGSRVRFRCKAHANPPQMSYTWYVGGRRVADAPEASTELVLDHVDRRLHNHVVRCEVTNPIGKTDESALLNVAYPPMFIKRPEDVAGDADERITLTCLVDANPKPTYAWYRLPSPFEKDGKRQLVGNAANLSFIVTKKSIGEYVCKATTVLPMTTIEENLDNNSEKKETISNNYVVHANAKVHMRSKPTIYAKHENFATVGEIGRVICEAISVPPVKPKGVEWFHSGGLPVIVNQPVNANEGQGRKNPSKFSVRENHSKEGVVSTLIINGVSEEDLGEYTCRVTNSLGTDSKVLRLKKFPSYNLVVVVSGALGGLVLTVAVIIILITCRRSRSSAGIDHGFCFGSNVSKGGDSSDIVTVINRKSKNSSSGKLPSNTHPHHHRTGAGSSSTTSTNDSGGEADGSQASNDSSSAELNKVEVRTSSSLSQNDGMVDDDDIDDVDGLHHHTHPSNAIGWGAGVKGLHVTSATGTARRGNGVAAPVPVHSTISNLQSSIGTTNSGSNYVHVHPHQQHQHTNNNNTNNKLNSLSANYTSNSTNNYGDSNYYSSNLLHGAGGSSNNGYGGNYGSYNPGFNSSPSSSAGAANASSSTNGGTSVNLSSSPRYNSSIKSADNLYSTGVPPTHHQTASSADINAKYSVHVRASPISPTYSQFSNGVSVKNCYPTYHPGGVGYGGGVASGKNTSFDYVSAPASQRTPLQQQRFNSQQHHQNMMDNYSVYVNSAGVTSSSSTSGLTPQPPPSSTSTIALHSDSSAAKIGSLATHV